MVDREAVSAWIRGAELPDTPAIYQALLDSGDTFSKTEGDCWDFKAEWPFSYSDSYFAGICRLICAFSNNRGGAIIFGVNDITRKGGKNRVNPNIDKLLSSFRSITGSTFLYVFKACENEEAGDIDILLVLPRPPSAPPLRFQRAIEGYQANVIWFRDGHEVVKAQPAHFPRLFCRSDGRHLDSSLDGSIPPSSSQIRKFVGRAEVMSNLFSWLQLSDEPRNYLFGKGGSGKTTIAREFSKLIKNFGQGIKIESEDSVDIVLFLSAKERELVSADATVSTIDTPDFFDEPSMLRKIIEESGGNSDLGDTADLDLSSLRSLTKEYFDTFSYLLVLDDIDTLTTKGVDSGADFLYRTLSRSKKKSKVLYTLRNAPSQSLHNSIEVPGLLGDDYIDFVAECVGKFGVKPPSNEFRAGRLAELSERRPLVIESIVALVRTAGSYEAADRLFVENVGDDVRDYVFRREWDALPSTELGRLLLAALADLNKPSSFEDLKTVLQAGDSAIRDAIGSVREMFLTIDDAGSETLFSVAPLTRGFINSRKSTVKFYEVLHERVVNYRKTIKISPPQVVRAVEMVRRIVPLKRKTHSEASLRDALRLVRDPTRSVKITEDPYFRSTRGYVEAIQPRPDMNSVRECFGYCLQMGWEPDIEELRSWIEAEKRSGVLEAHIGNIADAVVNGRRYSEEQKIEMISRKATALYQEARGAMHTEVERANALLGSCLLLHLRAFRLNANLGSPMLEVSERYARSTAYQWFRLSFDAREYSAVLEKLEWLLESNDGYLDPIEEPFREHLGKIEKARLTAPERGRLQNAVKRVRARKPAQERWLDKAIWGVIRSDIDKLVGTSI